MTGNDLLSLSAEETRISRVEKNHYVMRGFYFFLLTMCINFIPDGISELTSRYAPDLYKLPNFIHILLDYLVLLSIFSNEITLLISAYVLYALIMGFFKRKNYHTPFLMYFIAPIIFITSFALILAVLFFFSISLIQEAFNETLCKKTVYGSALSEDGKYYAEISENDCGALSVFHRRVTISRHPFTSYSRTVLYRRGSPSTTLEWKGRLLLIKGGGTPKNKIIYFGGVAIHHTTE